MGIKLSVRLQAIADYIPLGKTVADIGTDHALLPVYLVTTGVSPRVIGVEKASGPLAVARRNVAGSGLNGSIEIRAGDGLAPLRPGEAQVLVLAGMGGRKIADILGAAPAVIREAETLVLQPQEPVAPTRHWLISNHFLIADETLVEEDGRLYLIIRSVRGEPEPVDDLLLEIGPLLVARKHPLLSRYLAGIVHRYQQVLVGLNRSDRDELDGRRAAIRAKLERLKELQKCL